VTTRLIADADLVKTPAAVTNLGKYIVVDFRFRDRKGLDVINRRFIRTDDLRTDGFDPGASDGNAKVRAFGTIESADSITVPKVLVASRVQRRTILLQSIRGAADLFESEAGALTFEALANFAAAFQFLRTTRSAATVRAADLAFTLGDALALAADAAFAFIARTIQGAARTTATVRSALVIPALRDAFAHSFIGADVLVTLALAIEGAARPAALVIATFPTFAVGFGRTRVALSIRATVFAGFLQGREPAGIDGDHRVTIALGVHRRQTDALPIGVAHAPRAALAVQGAAGSTATVGPAVLVLARRGATRAFVAGGIGGADLERIRRKERHVPLDDLQVHVPIGVIAHPLGHACMRFLDEDHAATGAVIGAVIRIGIALDLGGGGATRSASQGHHHDQHDQAFHLKPPTPRWGILPQEDNP